MSNKKVDLISRHADVLERIESTHAAIAKLESAIAKPATSGNVDVLLQKDAEQRAELEGQRNALALLEKMLGDIAQEAIKTADDMQVEADRVSMDRQREQQAAFNELLKSKTAQQFREFVGCLEWLYASAGNGQYTTLMESSQWKETFSVSTSVAETYAKKAGIYLEPAVQNYELRQQLREMGEESLKATPAYASNEPRPMSVTHVQASEEDRQAMRDKITEAGLRGRLLKSSHMRQR